MTLAELRTIVRTIIDLNADEFSDFELDLYFKEATDHIHRWDDWSWQFKNWSFATALTEVALSALTDADGDVPKQVTAVRTADRTLSHANAPTMRGLMLSGSDGDPYYWAMERAETLLVYPKPSAAIAYTISGFRQPQDWQAGGAGASPDMPEQLHTAVYQFALSRCYAKLGDGGQSAYYLDLSQETIERTADDLEPSTFGEPTVIGLGEFRRDRDTNTVLSTRRGAYGLQPWQLS